MLPIKCQVSSCKINIPHDIKNIYSRCLNRYAQFPRDNTPSAIGVVAGYLAATAEWVAPLLLLAPVSVIGGELGTPSLPVTGGIAIIVAMHFYINFHIPPFDVWMLNFTPACEFLSISFRNTIESSIVFIL